jgi:hypothetical protein
MNDLLSFANIEDNISSVVLIIALWMLLKKVILNQKSRYKLYFKGLWNFFIWFGLLYASYGLVYSLFDGEASLPATVMLKTGLALLLFSAAVNHYNIVNKKNEVK